ncbi:MAG: hypothetical protein Ct9H300mP23_09970 [Nitrospinota bacterium]|nr:MAG: hypothetical protein Ct9H300mP23_09970 [Nitrospinota bacterium]
MFEVFNMGTGFCLVVESTNEVEAITKICKTPQPPLSGNWSGRRLSGQRSSSPTKTTHRERQSVYLANSFVFGFEISTSYIFFMPSLGTTLTDLKNYSCRVWRRSQI